MRRHRTLRFTDFRRAPYFGCGPVLGLNSSESGFSRLRPVTSEATAAENLYAGLGAAWSIAADSVGLPSGSCPKIMGAEHDAATTLLI